MQQSIDTQLVACFYEGISQPQRLAQGLQCLGDRLACERVSLNLWDRRGHWGMASHALRLGDGWQLKASEGELPDPALQALARKFKPGHWARLGYLFEGQAEPGRTAAKEMARKAMLCTRIELAQAEALITLYRPDGGWDDARPQIGQAADLSRALLPALDPIARLRHLSRQVACQSAVLDSVRMPIILMDSSQRPLAVNAAAAAIFKLAPKANGRKSVVALPGVAPSRFSQLVGLACADPATGGVLPFQPPPSHNAPASHLLVLPLRITCGGLPHPAALILVQGAGGLPEESQLLLQHVYGLTPAEARLAQLILDGQSPGNAASILQVSVATIRTQLSAVLKKTGAQRQSDLVRQLSPLLMLNHGTAAGGASHRFG